MFDVEGFQAFLKGLVGNRTQAQFAEEKGITKEHLNRMMRASSPARPTKATIKKLAGDSIGACNEMMRLCGYTDENDVLRVQTPEEEVEMRADELRFGFDEMTRNVRVYSRLQEFLDEYIMLYDSKKVSFRVGEKQEYDEGDHYGAEYIALMAAFYSFRGYTSRIFGAIYFSETKGGRVIVLDVAFEGSAVIRAGIRCGEDGKESIKDLPLVYRLQRNARTAEKLLESIFGTRFGEEVMTAEFGFGISFPKGFFTDEKVRDFLLSHRKGAEGNEYAERILMGEAASGVLEYYSTDHDVGMGPACLIAQVLREETGIAYAYYENVSKEEDAEDAVMLPRLYFDGCDMEKVKRKTRSAAAELGLPEYGECAVYVTAYIDKDNRFRTDEEVQ